MSIKYSDLPRKIKKGLKRNLKSTIDNAWTDKEIHIKTVEKCSRSFKYKKPDYKGYQITGYELHYKRHYIF